MTTKKIILAELGTTKVDPRNTDCGCSVNVIVDVQGMETEIFFCPQHNLVPLQDALYHLLEWATGNRGSKSGNPYGIPEVRQALEALNRSHGAENASYLNAKEIHRAQRNLKVNPLIAAREVYFCNVCEATVVEDIPGHLACYCTGRLMIEVDDETDRPDCWKDLKNEK